MGRLLLGVVLLLEHVAAGSEGDHEQDDQDNQQGVRAASSLVASISIGVERDRVGLRYKRSDCSGKTVRSRTALSDTGSLVALNDDRTQRANVECSAVLINVELVAAVLHRVVLKVGDIAWVECCIDA